jgi:hypothetical protein
MEALERERESDEEDGKDASHASTIKSIVERREAISASYGQDQAVRELCFDFVPGVALMSIGLLAASLGAFFVRPLRSTVLALVLVGIVSVCLYWRRIEKHRETRKRMRKSLAVEVDELGKWLPDRLRFLAESPDGDPYIKLVELTNAEH